MKKLFFGGLLIFVAMSCTQKSKSETEVVLEPDFSTVELKDHGAEPFVFDVEAYTLANENYRTAIWTGEYMQMTVMSLQPGEDIGLELHDDHDQFIRVESGVGKVMMGDTEEELTFVKEVADDFGIFIPAGKWHNVVNTGDEPLKLYSIYSPIEHDHSTVHPLRTDAEEEEHA